MDIKQKVGESFCRLKEVSPLVHQLSNYVTANDCANVTLAIGAKPIMADDINEVEDITNHAYALVLNLGTLNAAKLEAMLVAGRAANRKGIPVILDPVGVGASNFRKAAATKILNEIEVQIIKGNLSEIMVLNGMNVTMIGVDSLEKPDLSQDAIEHIKKIVIEVADKFNTIVVATGEVDLISDGKSYCTVSNGNSIMSKVTGMGCICTAVVGAYAGSIKDYYLATIAAVLTTSIAGERAYEKIRNLNEGSGSFRMRFIDEIYLLNKEMLIEKAKLEYFNI